MAGRVVVVGSVNVDLVVRAPRLPRPGETVAGGTFARHHGGKGGNQAVAAARLGARTALVAAVGDDELGTDAVADLAAEGVSTDHVVRVAEAPTGVALIVVDPTGENLIAVASGANARLTREGVVAALASLATGPGDVVLVDHEIPTDTTRAALEAARATGATTVLNPAPATGLDRASLSLVDIVTPNRGELEVLVEDGSCATLDAAQRLLMGAGSAGPGAVLVTLGERGALLVRPGAAPVEIPAPRVSALDATGAGDALNGALAASLAAGRSLPDAAWRAVAAATRSTTRPGARAGLPRVDELDDALRDIGAARMP